MREKGGRESMVKGIVKNGSLVLVITVLTLVLVTASVSAATISLVPSTTEVAPGEQFTLDIHVSDGTAKMVFVNFTFDPNLVSVVSTDTYGVFTMTDVVIYGSGYAKYLGVSPVDVDITGNPKVASITFMVSADAPDGAVITFTSVAATVDAADATFIAEDVTVNVKPWQKYDDDGDGDIEDSELINAIADWLNGDVSDDDLLEIILVWLT